MDTSEVTEAPEAHDSFKPNGSAFRVIKKLSPDSGGNVYLCLPRRLDPTLDPDVEIEDNFADEQDSERRKWHKISSQKRQIRLFEHRSKQMTLYRTMLQDGISVLDDHYLRMLPQLLVVKMHDDPRELREEAEIIEFLHKGCEEASLHIGSSIAQYQLTGIASTSWLCFKPILGRTLAQYGEIAMLPQNNRDGGYGGIPAWFVWHIFLSLLDAVDFIHAHGIVHNDINATNVMINPYPVHMYYRYRGYPDIQLIDFSEAKVIEVDEEDDTRTNTGDDILSMLRTMADLVRNWSDVAPFFSRSSGEDTLMKWHSALQHKVATTPNTDLTLADVKEEWSFQAEEGRNAGPMEIPPGMMKWLHHDLVTARELERAVSQVTVCKFSQKADEFREVVGGGRMRVQFGSGGCAGMKGSRVMVMRFTARKGIFSDLVESGYEADGSGNTVR